MTSLLFLLEREARRRGLLTDQLSLTPERAFKLVRDMPYKRASSRRPESIVEEWRGTCSGKHYLLAEIFRSQGMDSVVVMCTHQFTRHSARHFPGELQDMLAPGPIPDVHTYLPLNTDRGWMVVDATWPRSVASLGLTVNHEFNPGIDMVVACDPIDIFPVPKGQDPQQFKEQLIDQFCGTNSRLRDEFIQGMGHWLGELT